MIRDFKTLKEKLLLADRRTIAVAAAGDRHTLEAVRDAESILGIDYMFTGNPQTIMDISGEIGFKVQADRIIPSETDEEAAIKAVSIVRENRADALMKGKLQTGTLLKAALNKETGIRKGGLMSHLAVLECPSYHKLIFMTDGGMNTHPGITQKQAILENTVDFMKKLGYEFPKAAVLAAAETVSDKMPETADAAELTRLNAEGKINGCIVEGPLSFDLAISKESAEIKGIKSQVAGDVDILLMPDIASGNIMSKALLYLGGAKMAGVVLGAAVPVILVSRGATAEEKLLSIVLALSGN